MKVLLDSHLLIWLAGESWRLPAVALDIIQEPANEMWFSAASMWEITIKAALGKADFRVDPRLLRRRLLTNGYNELALSSEHAVAVLDLPAIHKDLFDRILIAQATIEGITLLTCDAVMGQYPGPVLKV